MFEINFSCHDLKISEKHHLKVNNKEYTNHYYIGNQRVVSKLGGGFLMDTVPQFNMMFGFHVLDPHAYNIKKLQDKAMVKRDLMGCGQPGTLQITTGLYNFLSHQPTRSDPEENINYYNGDHLGSTSYITDASGLPSQHVAYLPFGEVLLEEKSQTWQSPYKFNCKELDDESSVYYYGARYYDPRTSVWIGVDPMAEKYPGLSPFVYCANNPVRLVDPDGKRIHITGTEAAEAFNSTLLSFRGVNDNNMLAAFGAREHNHIYTAGGMNRRSFRNHFQEVTGVRLRGSELRAAYSLHKAMASEETLEIGVYKGGSPTTVYNPGEGGTIHTPDLPGFEQSSNNNRDLNNLRMACSDGVDGFNTSFDNTNSDTGGDSWKLIPYENPNQSGMINDNQARHSGTAIINGNRVTTVERRSQIIQQIIKTLDLPCSTCD